MDSPLVSVVIPFYNQVNWLTEAIDSILKQTFKDYEIILVNDGSAEDLKGFLEKYGEWLKYKYKENGGPATARNFGIEMAKGKYIAFLDSDDLWEPDKLEKQVHLMEEKDAVWSHSSYQFFEDGKMEDTKLVDLSYFKGIVFPRCLASTPIGTPCVMIRRDFLASKKYLRFNENMRFGQDWFLWVHLALEIPLYVIEEPLVKVRLRGGNASRRARVQINSKAVMWKTMKAKPDLFFGKRKVNRIMRFAYRWCACGDNLIRFIERKITPNNSVLEFIAKCIYLFPYLILKLLDKSYFKTEK